MFGVYHTAAGGGKRARRVGVDMPPEQPTGGKKTDGQTESHRLRDPQRLLLHLDLGRVQCTGAVAIPMYIGICGHVSARRGSRLRQGYAGQAVPPRSNPSYGICPSN